MTCIGRGHDPLMMRLVQRLIDQGVMQAPVNPIYEEVGEADEEWKLNEVVKPERGIRGRIVQLGVATDFTEKERGSEDGHYGQGDECLFDFKTNLVLEVFRMGESCMVEDEDVGERGAEKVYCSSK